MIAYNHTAGTKRPMRTQWLAVAALPLALAACETSPDEESPDNPVESEIVGCAPQVVLTHSRTDRLLPGEGLNVNESIFSETVRLTMQSDCNLVMEDAFNSLTYKPIWSSKTNRQGKTCFAHMQTDGNFVVYSQPACWTPVPVWSSQTNGRPNSYVRVQSDGNLVIYQGSRVEWASNTVQNHTVGSAEPPPPHPGCSFARTDSTCGPIPIPYFPRPKLCRNIYTCPGRGSVRPSEEADPWYACGACLGGTF